MVKTAVLIQDGVAVTLAKHGRLARYGENGTHLRLTAVPSALIGIGMMSFLLPAEAVAQDSVLSVSPLNAS